jgi:hypothetical protein
MISARPFCRISHSGVKLAIRQPLTQKRLPTGKRKAFCWCRKLGKCCIACAIGPSGRAKNVNSTLRPSGAMPYPKRHGPTLDPRDELGRHHHANSIARSPHHGRADRRPRRLFLIQGSFTWSLEDQPSTSTKNARMRARWCDQCQDYEPWVPPRNISSHFTDNEDLSFKSATKMRSQTLIWPSTLHQMINFYRD